MHEMLNDPDASFRTDAVLYQDFLVRCRIRRVPGEPLSLPAFRRNLAVARAGIDGETAQGEPWQQALELSKSLPDDVQGVFFIVAQAAVTANPARPTQHWHAPMALIRPGERDGFSLISKNRGSL